MILIFHPELSLHRDFVFVGESIVLSPRAIPASLESSHEPTRDIPLMSWFDRVHTKSTASGCFVTTDPIAEFLSHTVRSRRYSSRLIYQP